MALKYYQIEKYQDAILVTLRGSWDLGINIRYLSSLAEALDTRKGKKFRLLVDMRDWQAPNTPSAKRIKAAFQLDRRNQYAEIWLENESTDSEHLAAKFFNHVSFTLVRVNTIAQFIECACSNDSDEVKAYITDWITRYKVDKQN